MKTKLSDFRFVPAGYGHVKVKYVDPRTGQVYTKTTDNMSLIDKTKNADEPTQEDLDRLGEIVQGENFTWRS